MLRYPATPLSDGVVTLRAKTPEDVEAIVEAAADPEIPRWTRVPSPYTAAHAEEWLEGGRAELEAGTSIDWLVTGSDGGLLGAIGLMQIDHERGYGEIGYWIAAPARGRGVAGRAVRLVRDWAIAELHLGLVEVLVHERNAASLAVARRAGFEDTGERRDSVREGLPEGRYVVLVSVA